MIGFLLNIIADILKWALHPIAWVWGTIESLIRKEHDEWEGNKAYAKDVFGCVLIKYPANWILIKRNGYKFGQKGDSISRVLGINKLRGTLSKLGIIISNILNWIDENHVEKAIK